MKIHLTTWNSRDSLIFRNTRMHSSGMRTARLLTVSQYALAGGGCLPRGVSAGGGAVCPGVSARGLSAQGGVCPGGVCSGGCLPLVQRGCLPRGVSASGPMGVYPSMQWGKHPPVDRQTPLKT